MSPRHVDGFAKIGQKFSLQNSAQIPNARPILVHGIANQEISASTEKIEQIEYQTEVRFQSHVRLSVDITCQIFADITCQISADIPCQISVDIEEEGKENKLSIKPKCDFNHKLDCL